MSQPATTTSSTTATSHSPQAKSTVVRRFGRRTRNAILTLHVVSPVALVGTTASIIVLAVRAADSGAVDAHALYDTGLAVAFVLAIPFSFTSLVSGIALGLGTSWGLLRYYWVVAKIALQVAIIATGALLVGPALQNLADASGSGLAHSDLGNERWLLAVAGACNLLFAASGVALAVLKPWGRIRGPRDGTGLINRRSPCPNSQLTSSLP